MTNESVAITLFWLGIAATAYAYAGFPLLAAIAAKYLSRRPCQSRARSSRLPTVSVLIPAFNEDANIASKLANTLASDYPTGLLDIMVISDASTDRTNAIARSFERDNVRLLIQPTRRGKSAGLNRAVAVAHGDILVLTDANAEYAAETISRLVAHLCDPTVGLATGYTRYLERQGSQVAEVTNLYTSLERSLKRAESCWGYCVGADGAVFAMRRSLYRPLRDDDINDFVLPLAVIQQGYACTFAEDAWCAEEATADIESEFRRQSRITNRTLRALARNITLLNPFRFPLFAFLLFSHKGVRLLAPPLLAVSTLALANLGLSGGRYAYPAALVLLFGACGIVYLKLRTSAAPRALRILRAFATINLAVLDGWRKFITGQTDVVWQHDRSASAGHLLTGNGPPATDD